MTETEATASVAIGLLSDPDLPTELARKLVDELPRLLTERVSDQLSWEVSVADESPPVVDDGEVDWRSLASKQMRQNDWDFAICLTEMPRRVGLRPIAVDANTDEGIAVLSIPALGAWRLKARVARTVVRLANHFIAERLVSPAATRQDEHVEHKLSELFSPTSWLYPDSDGIDVRLAVEGVRGRFRLLTGMVRTNRPWRFALGLSSVLAASLATSAYALSSSSVWLIADHFGPGRLALAAIASIATMVIWLVARHRLWERATEPGARKRSALYNTATVLTLLGGVLCFYGALFVIDWVAASVFIDRALLAKQVSHPVGFGQYLTLAWAVVSLSTVAGAVGSGLESDEVVRRAAYGNREQERRAAERQSDDEEPSSNDQAA